MKKIALIGEYDPGSPSHQATNGAILHANKNIDGVWVSTKDVTPSLFDEYDGIWITPGGPHKNVENTLWAIRYARENNVPCLGTCGGFQHIAMEYARHVLGLKDVHHAEYDPDVPNPVISPLHCSLVDREVTIQFVAESKVAQIYGCNEAVERSNCKFGINPSFVEMFKKGPMYIVGFDSEGEVRAVEIPTHPFFIGTLFVPQINSTPARPHPLILHFLKVVELTS